jgi:hypothetical protein
MTQKKLTPGTVVYTTDTSPYCKSIYIAKGTWTPMPQAIEVTIEPTTVSPQPIVEVDELG